MISDQIHQVCLKANKYELCDEINKLRKLVQVIPQYKEIFQFGSQDNEDIESQFYTLPIIQNKSSNQQNNEDKKLFNNLKKIVNPAYIMSIDEIISDIGQRQVTSYSTSKVSSKEYQLVNSRNELFMEELCKILTNPKQNIFLNNQLFFFLNKLTLVFQIQKKAQTNNAASSLSTQQKAKAIKYFLNLQQKLTGSEQADYNKYVFIDQSNSNQVQSIKIYKKLYSLIQINLLKNVFLMSINDAKIFYNLVTHNMSYDELNLQIQMSEMNHRGKLINSAIVEFDDRLTQQNLNMMDLLKMQPGLDFISENSSQEIQLTEEEQLEKAKKEAAKASGNVTRDEEKRFRWGKGSIVNDIVDQTVLYMERFMNLNETFNSMKHELQQIFNHMSADKANESTFSKFTQDYRNFLKEKIFVEYRKFMIGLRENYLIVMSTNPNSQLSEKYFDVWDLLFSGEEKNNLSLKHFNSNCVWVSHNQRSRGKLRFSSGQKEYHRFTKNLFYQQNNLLITKLQTIFTNMPIQIDRFVGKIQKKSGIQVKQVGNMSNYFQQLKEEFCQNQIVQTREFSTLCLPNYSYLMTQMMSIIQGISEVQRIGVGGQIKNLERNIQSYFKYQAGLVYHSIQSTFNFVQLISDNILLSQTIPMLRNVLNYPIYGGEYYKNMKKQKELMFDDLNDVKARWDNYNKENAFRIHDYQLIQIKDVHLMKEDEELVRIFRVVLEYCIERQLLLTELEQIYFNDANTALQAEFLIHDSVIGMVEARIAQLINEKLGNKARSMLPRVKLNPLYTSPLFKDAQNPQLIPGIAQIAFLQNFLNRFRNKVTRVDLLSSGFGFVISVTDLDDCVSYLNRSLISFCDQEFKQRLQTFQYVYDLQKSRILELEQDVTSLKQKIQYMDEQLAIHSQALVHEKGNNLLYQLGLMNKKTEDFQRFILGLEQRVREEFRRQTAKEMIEMQTERTMMRNQFAEYKKTVTVLFNSQIIKASKQMDTNLANKAAQTLQTLNEIENKYRAEINNISASRSKLSVLQLESSYNETEQSESVSVPQIQQHSHFFNFLNHQMREKKLEADKQLDKTTFIENLKKEMERSKSQVNWEAHRCGNDEDVIMDPYVCTQLISKLRIFYIMKITLQKQKYEEKINQINQEIVNFKQVHEQLVQSQIQQDILKNQLVHVHNVLKLQETESEKLQKDFDLAQIDQSRNQKMQNDLQKQMKLLEEQIKELSQSGTTSYDPNYDLKVQDDQIDQMSQHIKVLQSQINATKKSNQSQLKNIQVKLKSENQIKGFYKEKLENVHFPIIDLNLSADISWKDKSQELYLKLKEMEEENQRLRSNFQHILVKMYETPLLLDAYPKLKEIHETSCLILNNQLKENPDLIKIKSRKGASALQNRVSNMSISKPNKTENEINPTLITNPSQLRSFSRNDTPSVKEINITNAGFSQQRKVLYSKKSESSDMRYESGGQQESEKQKFYLQPNYENLNKSLY